MTEKLKGPGAGNTGPLETDQLGGSIDPKANSFPAENQQAQATAPITVTVHGAAVAKARVRFTRKGFAYTPSHTRKYEAHGRLAAQLAMGDKPPLTRPVSVTALIELPIPASWSKRDTAAAIVGEIRPTSRPDIDNYLKSAMDAINGIVIADDSLIVEVTARKKYGLNPKLVLLITPLGAMASNREPSQ